MAILDPLKNLLSLPGLNSGTAPALPAPKDWKSQTQIVADIRTQTRAIDSYTSYPSLETQLLAIQGLTDRPWRYPSITEALGTPAIFRAVSLISATVGSLGLEAFRNGVRLPDEEIPRIIKRPDPFRVPRNFYRDSAFYLATRGECWWWVGARDADGLALSLIVVPPWEITIEQTDDRLRPKILWTTAKGNTREMRREDMRHITYMPDDTGYRGVGPLQVCGAAMSVAVEAQNWAANFFAEGGWPSTIIKSATELGSSDDVDAATEAEALRNQWMSKDHNTPRVIDPGIEDVTTLPVDTAGAQMLQARDYNNGDAARMFGMPGALLEYSAQGSSLTYQNDTSIWRHFQEGCLSPYYLEPIEQELSDLLTRSTVARFKIGGLLRSDAKTRAEIYQILIPLNVMTAEQAAAEEGYLPGDVEFSPVPFSTPQAFPSRLPVDVRSAEPVRCSGTRMLRGLIKPCGKLLAEAGPFVGRCPRCSKEYGQAA